MTDQDHHDDAAPLDVPEEELLRVGVLSAPGAFARVGEVVLTNQNLRFEPSRLDALAGADEWNLRVADITKISRRGLNRALIVESSGPRMRLLGAGVEILHDRLAALLLHLGRDVQTRSTFEPSERILLHGPVEFAEPGALMTVTGEMSLTNRKLTCRSAGMDRLLFKADKVEFPLTAALNVSIAPVRRVMTLDGPSGMWELRGPLVTQLYAWVRSLQEEHTTGRDGTDVVCVEAAYVRDPLQHPGFLSINSRSVRFVPNSRVDALLGAADDLAIPFASTLRMEVRGAMDRTLKITTQDRTHAFVMADPRGTFRTVVQRCSAVGMDGEPALGAVGQIASPADVDALLLEWAHVIPEEHRAGPRLVGPVLWQQGRRTAERGWVVLTATAAIVLPDVVPGNRMPWVFHMDDLLEPRTSDVLSHVLDLSKADGSLLLRPRGRRPFVELFWALRPNRPPAPRPEPQVPVRKSTSRYTRDRRETFRASPTEPLDVELVVEEPRLPGSREIPRRQILCLMRDISAEGVGAYAEERLEPGSRCQVRFSPLTSPLEVPGVVHYAARSSRPDLPWRHGIQLMGMDGYTSSKVEDLWMSIQRAWIQRQRETEDEESVTGDIDLPTDPSVVPDR